MVAFIKSKDLRTYLTSLEQNGCRVDHSKDAGTAVVYDGETVVLRALQKGKGGPWITRMFSSERIKWSKPGIQ